MTFSNLTFQSSPLVACSPNKRCAICPLKRAASGGSGLPLQRRQPPFPELPNSAAACNAGASTAGGGTATNRHLPVYRYYAQRWLVLSTVCLLALSNATQWISFAPLHDAANAFYCVQEVRDLWANASDYNAGSAPAGQCDVEMWTSQIFQIVGVVTGIFGMYITDRYGIRVSCHFGAALNLAGAVLRVVSSLPELDRHRRLPVLYFGQTIAAMSQPFFLCLSPKVAEYWFPEHQRTLANSLSFIANPFGVVVGSIVPVLFVFSREARAADSPQIFHLNAALLGLALLVMLLCVCVNRSRPPSPPSVSSQCEHKPGFAEGLGILFRSRVFYIQTLTFGMAFALQWSIFVTADKYLLRLGYPDKLAGYLLSLSAFSGTLASILAGFWVDRTKRFNEYIKGSYVGLAITGATLNIYLRHSHHSGWDTAVLVLLLTSLGFFAIPVFPISLELGVESTFPVAEATSSGILIIAGQLQLFLLTFAMQFLESTQWVYAQTDNYQLSVDFWTLFAVFAALFSCAFLWPEYHRLAYEQNAIFLNLLPPRFEEINNGNAGRSKRGKRCNV